MFFIPFLSYGQKWMWKKCPSPNNIYNTIITMWIMNAYFNVI